LSAGFASSSAGSFALSGASRTCQRASYRRPLPLPCCKTAPRVRRRDRSAVSSFRAGVSRHLALVRRRIELVRTLAPPAAAFALSSAHFARSSPAFEPSSARFAAWSRASMYSPAARGRSQRPSCARRGLHALVSGVRTLVTQLAAVVTWLLVLVRPLRAPGRRRHHPVGDFTRNSPHVPPARGRARQPVVHRAHTPHSGDPVKYRHANVKDLPDAKDIEIVSRQASPGSSASAS
jgi:hypothetical protein